MAGPADGQRPGEERLPRAELVKVLGASLGQEKATDAIEGACTKLRLGTESYTIDETMRILDLLAVAPELVGTVARFAKARVILKFGQM